MPQTGGAAQGVVQLGRALSQAGTELDAAARVLDANAQAQKEFDAETKYQQYRWEQEQALETSLRGLTPETAPGFVDRWNEGFTKQTGEFLATIPEDIRAKYDNKLFTDLRRLHGSASGIVHKKQADFSEFQNDNANETIDRSRARTARTGQELDEATAEMSRRVDLDPYMDGFQKAKKKQEYKRKIGLSYFNSRPDSEKLRLVEGRRGMEQSVTAEALLRDFEGFITTPKYDVNALRVGYGSDETTLPDGTVVPVTEDTRVTREDAERDLARRVIEFGRTAENQMGDQIWDALPGNARAALTSVAYNYGSLPKSVVAAARTGDTNAIADAVAALRDNPDRRKKEAAIIRASGGALPESLGALTEDDWTRLEKRFDDVLKKRARAEDLFAGRTIADPDNKDDRQAIDSVVEATDLNDKLGAMDPGASEALTRIVDTTAILPTSSLSTLRSMAANGTPQERQYALQATARMMRQKPGSLDGPGAAELRDDARKFSGFVLGGGLSPQEALQRLDETKTEEFRAREAALGKQATAEAKKLKPEDITGAFDTLFSFEPELGATKVRGQIMFDAFKENFKFHYIATGDERAAKEMALEDVKSSYDVSSLLGTNRLMKHPPEKYYPTVDGSHDYVTEQLSRDVAERAGREISINDIFLEAVPQTDADIRAKRLPRYGISWRREDGKLDTAPGMVWRPDFESAKKRQSDRLQRRFRQAKERLRAIETAAETGAELELIEPVGATPEAIAQEQAEQEEALAETLELGALS